MDINLYLKEPVSSSRGREVWLGIQLAKLEAPPSSRKCAQPVGKGGEVQNSLKHLPVHKRMPNLLVLDVIVVSSLIVIKI